MVDEKRDNNGRFVKGHCGGPGKPRGTKTVRQVLHRLFTTNLELDDIYGVPKSMPVIDGLQIAQIKKALKEGDTRAYKELMDRYEGKPHQTQEVEMSGEITFAELMKKASELPDE